MPEGTDEPESEPDLHGFDERAEAVDSHSDPASPSAMDLLALGSKPLPPDRRLQAAWVASMAVLLFLLGSALLWRSSVMASWPASERLYGWIGMQPAHVPAKTADAAPAAHR